MIYTIAFLLDNGFERFRFLPCKFRQSQHRLFERPDTYRIECIRAPQVAPKEILILDLVDTHNPVFGSERFLEVVQRRAHSRERLLAYAVLRATAAEQLREAKE